MQGELAEREIRPWSALLRANQQLQGELAAVSQSVISSGVASSVAFSRASAGRCHPADFVGVVMGGGMPTTRREAEVEKHCLALHRDFEAATARYQLTLAKVPSDGLTRLSHANIHNVLVPLRFPCPRRLDWVGRALAVPHRWPAGATRRAAWLPRPSLHLCASRSRATRGRECRFLPLLPASPSPSQLLIARRSDGVRGPAGPAWHCGNLQEEDLAAERAATLALAREAVTLREANARMKSELAGLRHGGRPSPLPRSPSGGCYGHSTYRNG